jgi:hypothetical protein
MLTGAYRANDLMRLTLGCTLVFLLLFWVTNALLYFRSMSFDPTSVVRYYNGSEAEFTMPRTYGAMLEVTHAHLAMMALVLLLLTHLAIFIPWPRRLRVALVLSAFAGGLLSEAAGWLVRFVSPELASVKIAGFVLLQTSLAVLLFGLAGHLLRPPDVRAFGAGMDDLKPSDRPLPGGISAPRR